MTPNHLPPVHHGQAPSAENHPPTTNLHPTLVINSHFIPPAASITNSNPARLPHGHDQTLIRQWNINGYFNNLADLELLVRDLSPTVLAIQEIHRADIGQLNRSL